MDLDEAFKELGIARDTPPDQARRAYLKLLKTRKPETDPQGFMRLREAFDTVKQWQETYAFLQLHRLAEPEPEPVPVPPPPREDPAPETHDDRAQGDTKSDEDDPPEDDDEAPEQDDETAAGPEEVLDGLLRDEKYTAAAVAMEGVFDHASDHIDDATPPLHAALRLLFLLHRENEVEAASDLLDSVAGWLKASGQEARMMRGEVAARWQLLRELGVLPATFPADVRAPIAVAMLAGNLGHANGTLETVRRSQPKVARAAASVMRAHTPLLAAALAHSLNPPPVAQPAPVAHGGSKSGWVIVGVIVALLRLVLLLAKPSTSYSPPRDPTLDPARFAWLYDAGGIPPARDAGIRIFSPPPSNGRRTVSEGADSVKMHAFYMLGVDAGGRRIDYEKVVADIDRTVAAVNADDCRGAERAIARLRAAFAAKGADDDVGRREAEGFAALIKAHCAEVGRLAGRPDASRGPVDAGHCGGTSDP